MFTGTFTDTPTAGVINGSVIADTSSFADEAKVTFSGRRVYLYKPDGSTIVPAGTTTAYINFPFAGGDSLPITCLTENDYSINILVVWIPITPVTNSVYSAVQVYSFIDNTQAFKYNLIRSMADHRDYENDDVWMNALNAIQVMIDSVNTCTVFQDQYAAQKCIDNATFLINNQNDFFGGAVTSVSTATPFLSIAYYIRLGQVSQFLAAQGQAENTIYKGSTIMPVRDRLLQLIWTSLDWANDFSSSYTNLDKVALYLYALCDVPAARDIIGFSGGTVIVPGGGPVRRWYKVTVVVGVGALMQQGDTVITLSFPGFIVNSDTLVWNSAPIPSPIAVGQRTYTLTYGASTETYTLSEQVWNGDTLTFQGEYMS